MKGLERRLKKELRDLDNTPGSGWSRYYANQDEERESKIADTQPRTLQKNSNFKKNFY